MTVVDTAVLGCPLQSEFPGSEAVNVSVAVPVCVHSKLGLETLGSENVPIAGFCVHEYVAAGPPVTPSSATACPPTVVYRGPADSALTIGQAIEPPSAPCRKMLPST